jgi:hypothetical protein
MSWLWESCNSPTSICCNLGLFVMCLDRRFGVSTGSLNLHGWTWQEECQIFCQSGSVICRMLHKNLLVFWACYFIILFYVNLRLYYVYFHSSSLIC